MPPITMQCLSPNELRGCAELATDFGITSHFTAPGTPNALLRYIFYPSARGTLEAIKKLEGAVESLKYRLEAWFEHESMHGTSPEKKVHIEKVVVAMIREGSSDINWSAVDTQPRLQDAFSRSLLSMRLKGIADLLENESAGSEADSETSN